MDTTFAHNVEVPRGSELVKINDVVQDHKVINHLFKKEYKTTFDPYYAFAFTPPSMYGRNTISFLCVVYKHTT